MPELPEVETIKLGVTPYIIGQVFDDVVVRRRDMRWPIPEHFEELVKGQRVLDVTRRSKYLKIHLENKYVIIVHFGMSGRLRVENQGEELQKHDHVILYICGKQVVLNDPRRFGGITIERESGLKNHMFFKELAPEPFEMSVEDFWQRIKGRKTSIKSAILNQKNIVGVGNIYACEALFLSGISATKSCSELTRADAEKLLSVICRVLEEAIQAGGSSLKDHRQVGGEMGYFQHSFKVYGRENEPCYVCFSTIERVVQNQRSTFFCPNCQS